MHFNPDLLIVSLTKGRLDALLVYLSATDQLTALWYTLDGKKQD